MKVEDPTILGIFVYILLIKNPITYFSIRKIHQKKRKQPQQ